MPLLEIQDLCVKYGGITIVDSVCFSVEPGEWLVVAGPNGAGKSTLLGAVAQTVPYSGQVRFLGEDMSAMKPRAAARCVGMLSQSHSVGYAFSVKDVVRMGRYAYGKGPLSGGQDPEGETAVQQALSITGMLPFARRSVLTLSGGELQRTFLAQLFAQAPRVLLLDEPSNHLDLMYQQQIFSLLRGWIERTGGSVVSVVHDLSIAKAHADRALLLCGGRAVACGAAEQALSPENLQKVYSIDVYGYMRGMLEQWQ